MSHPILVTGAAGGLQGSTGRTITALLLEQGIPVRAFVHKLDDRSEQLEKLGAEIFEGDLLNPASVRAAMKGVKRAYFTYPVIDGLLEAATILSISAQDAGLELLVNNSQLQGMPGEPGFRDLHVAPTFRNLQHRLADRIFDWAGVHAVHLQAPPYYENVRALVSRSVAAQDTVFLPWGDGEAVFPLTGAEDVARVAATLLASPGTPAERIYPLVSQAPKVREIVETLSRVLKRPIRYVPITDEQWAEAAQERVNPHALAHLSRLWMYFRQRTQIDLPTDAIRTVTGRNPQTLEEFFRANVDSFAPALKTA
jgi:uncharacterized protein YbjT (DUF2867 family)